jgi:hypothetical protein
VADSWQALIALADRLEPELRADFLRAVQALRDSIDVDALVAAIRAGRTAADMAIDFRAFDRDLQQQVGIINDAVLQAGALTAQQVGQAIGVPSLRFNITNPYAVEQARRIAAAAITNIEAETKLAIRAIVTRSFTEGLTSDQVARMIRSMIGLNEGQAIAVFNYRRMLIDQGISGDRVDQMVSSYARQALISRADMIARTEIMSASNVGQEALWQQARQARLIADGTETEWIITPDDRLCKRCQSMKGQRQPLGVAFECPLDGTKVFTPPLHPRCRCVRALVVGSFKERSQA